MVAILKLYKRGKLHTELGFVIPDKYTGFKDNNDKKSHSDSQTKTKRFRSLCSMVNNILNDFNLIFKPPFEVKRSFFFIRRKYYSDLTNL